MPPAATGVAVVIITRDRTDERRPVPAWLEADFARLDRQGG